MKYTILSKHQLSAKVYRFDIYAPLIARARRAGHFVILRHGEKGERIPLTIVGSDPEKGSITLIVQAAGASTARLCALEPGEAVTDVAGPLGQATHIENYGTVLCAAGGVGIAPMFPIMQALKAAGNRVVAVLAGRTKELVILREETEKVADDIIVMTDDGSLGIKGLVTDGMEKVIKRERVDKCFAIGPAVMMKHCCLLTKQYDIPTDVSLNTIMIDGTGMCGACRVTVGGQMKFVCVDGPEFDGHQVDFDEMMRRMGRRKAASQEETAVLSLNELTDRNAPWRKTLREKMTARERTSLHRVKMPELDAMLRSRSLTEEVNRGLTEEQALHESHRCLDCTNPRCVSGCPVGIDIPSFIKNIERGEYLDAARVLRMTSALPAVCGRVCPQEKQCESHCIHLKMRGEPVAIGYLERFAADFEREHGGDVTPSGKVSQKGVKVCCIGSGPSGLSFAGDMAGRGYDVTVFEALHEIGGVLKYGIPEFRLPNRIVDHEIESLKKLGVHFVTDCIVGKTLTVRTLEESGFKGIYVASGAGLPRFMGIPGENAAGVLSANEYLTRVNLMGAGRGGDTPVPTPRHVLVVGGGNTAMDACRTARRMGAEVTLAYRRSEAEMPARREEIRHAIEEGITFLTLHNPVEYITDSTGVVERARLQRMRLGEPDESGRRRPEPIPDDMLELSVGMVIVAIGTSPNPIVPHAIPGLELGRKGTILVHDNMETAVHGIFAGGDIVRGGATVILAMGDGRKAAFHMAEELEQ